MKVLFTVEDVATQAGLSRRAVRDALARGELAGCKRAGRWLVTADALQAWATPSPLPKPRNYRAVGRLAPVGLAHQALLGDDLAVRVR